MRNNTDTENLAYVSVTPPATDAFPALPTGGVKFTVDDTEHGDSVILRLWKFTSDANIISISHVVIVPDIGYGLPHIDNSDVATSGTGEDDLATLTVTQNSMGATGGLRITAAGTKTGGNGNKTIKLYWGSSGWEFNAAANDTNDWRVEAEIFNTAVNAQRISWQGWNGATPLQGYETETEVTTADVTLKITGECADGGDTITQTMWIVERL